MKNIKRPICLLLVALMAFSLFACSDDKKGNDPDASSAQEVSGVEGESSVNTEPTPVPEKEIEIVEVTGDGVYIRADASTELDPLGSADKGDVFELISKDDPDWFKISYNGQEAYITTLYSKLKSVKESAFEALFPEEPEEEPVEGDADGAEDDEESSGVNAEETRNNEDGER